MIWITTYIFGLIFLIGNIKADKYPNTTDGKNATVKSFPFIISIRSNGFYHCSGSIISDRHILTAAHAVAHLNGSNSEDYTIHSGTSAHDGVGNVHKILSVHVHPTYNTRRDISTSDDVAVIKLKEPIEFNKHQQKINLPSHDIQKYQAAYAFVWSRKAIDSGLKKLQVALMASDKCKPLLREATIDEKQGCTFSDERQGECHAVSGGPLVSHGEVVGVASMGYIGECTEGVPDIFTNVFAHKDFIESAMKE